MTDQVESRVQKLDQKGRSWGSGKRKSAKASVRLIPGMGNIKVNGQDYKQYFRDRLEAIENDIRKPFEAVGMSFDVQVKAQGGGLNGQADAVRLAISRAIVNYNPALYQALRENGLMTPDTRRVQSKKYGYVKARKSKPTSRR